MSNHFYGEAPEEIMYVDLDGVWTEFMHYLYLPIRLPSYDGAQYGVPRRLRFLEHLIDAAYRDALNKFEHFDWDAYVYVTARRGYATPGNPLNRPGWHCDDFGGTDVNYTWCDQFPTRWLRSDEPLQISPDDTASMSEMAHHVAMAESGRHTGDHRRIEEVPLNTMMRLSPYVIHDTPIIRDPGGMRSFFKISVSTHRYDLVGNSHNWLLDYDWPMHSREALRNQPNGGNSDYSGATP